MGIDKMKIAKVRDVKTPERGTGKSAGIDFFIPADFEGLMLAPGHDVLIPSGIKASIPEGYMLMAADKSGVVTSSYAVEEAGRKPKATAFNSVVILGAKIVDEDYQGEIHIHLVNVGREIVELAPGMKIAQFILVPVSYEGIEVVDERNLFAKSTERGDGGFGSTDAPKQGVNDYAAKVISTKREQCKTCQAWTTCGQPGSASKEFCMKAYDSKAFKYQEGKLDKCERYVERH